MSEGRTKMLNSAHQKQEGTEKPRDFKATWSKMIAYCKAYIPVIAIALVGAALGTGLQIIGPDKLKDMTNEIAKGLPALLDGQPVLGSIDIQAVANIAWVLVFFYGASALLSFVQSFIMATVTQKVSKSLRTDISEKINRLPLKYFDKTSYGDVLSRVTNDVDAIGQTLNQSIGTLADDADHETIAEILCSPANQSWQYQWTH